MIVTRVDLSGRVPTRLSFGCPAPKTSSPRNTSWPVILRWVTSVYSLERSMSSTLARLRTPVTPAPSKNCRTSLAGFGKLLAVSLMASSMTRPTMSRSSPRLTVSTSGNSGMVHPLSQLIGAEASHAHLVGFARLATSFARRGSVHAAGQLLAAKAGQNRWTNANDRLTSDSTTACLAPAELAFQAQTSSSRKQPLVLSEISRYAMPRISASDVLLMQYRQHLNSYFLKRYTGVLWMELPTF